MKVKVIFTGKEKATAEIAKALGKGLEDEGHQVSLEDCYSTEKPLGVMQYDKVIIGCSPSGFWKKKTPFRLQESLKRIKGLMGKKTIVFIKPGLIRNNQALRTVMNDVERISGAFVENFTILKNRKEGEEFGRSLKVE